MKTSRDLQDLAWCAVAVFSAAAAQANPSGLTVASGSASAVTSGSTLNVTASQNAVLNWQSFNIGANETVNFEQPSSISVVWNRILDSNPSQIWGHLNANGTVVLMNQNGFYFGPNSCVMAGGFVAAGAWVTPPASGGGAMWTYQGPPPSASIINYGEIKVNTGGSIFLVAEKIENHGVLTAPDGTLGLYAGKQVLLSERPDGRGLSAAVTLPDGSVDNLGKISADAGTIALHAQVVNQDGLLQANSVRDNHGVIELVASDAVNLGADSVITANGDASGASAGGAVTIKSGGTYSDDPASVIQVRGGAEGGNGGTLELSAAKMSAINSRLDGSAQAGSTGGSLLLDPYDIELSDGSGDTSSSSTVNANDPPADPGDVLQLDINTAFKNQHFSQVTLQALHDITLDDGLNWNLNSSIGTAAGSSLTLEAGHNINFGSVDGNGAINDPNNGAKIVSGQTAVGGVPVAGTGWSVTLLAGVDFSLATPAVQSGVGGIYNCKIQSLAGGDITLDAGHEVLVGGGYLRTFNGGNISITTGDGDVNAGQPSSSGQHNNTYSTDDNTIDTTRGGIATEKGGDVTINAGGNIYSTATTIGALGAGDVSLTAGGDIKGYFYLRNGIGTMNAGGDVGDGANGVTLGLTSGGWNVFAPNGSIYLNEIYNFNGALGANHLFDFAPDAYANLVAGNSVQLMGDSPVSPTVGKIYPPKLTVAAGAGGVALGGDITLFPSAQGGLDITTTAGGSLYSMADGFYRLKVSDGDSSDYTTFADGHAATPVHLGETGYAVNLSIDGDVDNLFLRSPGEADITIHGNANNFSFEGQNLATSEKTSITIGGDYSIRSSTPVVTVNDGGQTENVPVVESGAATFVTLTDDADMKIFQPALVLGVNDPVPTAADVALGGKLYYNPTTHQLGFYNNMTAIFDAKGNVVGGDLYNLLHPTVIKTVNGVPQYDSKGNPVVVSAVFTTDTAAILALYQASQDLPLPSDANNGLVIHGPGTFQISAHNMNLGASAGIQSLGAFDSGSQSLGQVMVQNNQVLPGADIVLNLSGNLDMVSSEIFSSAGGSIFIASQGTIDVGQENAPFINDSAPRGIYTGHGGDVTVLATGDINVNGSRIASYDGGNVTVESGTPVSAKNSQPIDWTDVVVGPNNILYVADASGGEVYDQTTVDKKTGTISFDTLNGKPVTDAKGNPIHGYLVTVSGGSVNAGTGSGGFFYLNAYSKVEYTLDAKGNVIPSSIHVAYDNTNPDQFFGSGIIAMTSTSSDAHVGNINVVAGGDIQAGTGGILQLAFNKVDQSSATLNLHTSSGNIDAGDSGVLGQNIDAKSDLGSVKGLFVASGNENITAGQKVDVTALASGHLTLSGGEGIQGTAIGGEGVTVTGAPDPGALTTVSGGNASSAFQGVTAPAAQKTTEDASQTVAQNQDNGSGDDEDKKKRGKAPVLAQKVSRVTVILPKKS